MRTELPENWYVVITIKNKPIVKEWWENNGYGARSWNTGAFYGYSNEYDKPISKSNDSPPENMVEITFEEFECLVLNKPTEPQYEVY